MKNFSSYITDCQDDFEKGKLHEKHLHINIEASFLCLSVYDYVVINDSWFLILKMNGYLAAYFYKFHVLEKQKLIKTKQRVTWVRELKS